MKIGERIKGAVAGFFGKRDDVGIKNIINWIEGNQAGRNLYFKELRTVQDAISRNSYVRRTFEIISSLISSLPREVQNKDGEKQENTLFHKVMAKPNVYQSWSLFIRETVGWAINSGRYAWKKELDGSGKVIMAYNLEASKLTPKVAKNSLNPIGGFNYGGQSVPVEDVIYNYWWTPASGFVGESPLKSALDEVAASVAITRVIRSLAENQQRPGGLIVPKEGLGQDDYDKLVKAFNKGRAPDLAGYYDVLPIDVDLKQAIITPHEAQLNETQEAIKAAIYAATGVSQILLESGKATYENQDIATQNLWKLTLMPIIKMIEESLNEIIQSYDKTWKIVFDLSGVSALKPDFKDVAEVLVKLKGWISRDEGRELLPGQYEPLLMGGDEVPDGAMIVPVGLAPPVQAKQKKSVKKPRPRQLSKMDILLGELNREEKKIETKSDMPERKAAGGLTGQQRDIYYTCRKIELDGYSRLFASGLRKLYRKQGSTIKEMLENADDDLSNIPDPEEWLDWKNERAKFVKMAHPKLLGVFSDSGKKITDEFEVLAIHKKEITRFSETFSTQVNKTTLDQLTEAFNSIGGKRFVDGEFVTRQEDEDEEKKTRKEEMLLLTAVIFLWAENARTEASAHSETHTAQGYGHLEGGRQLGSNTKVWLASFVNTRDAHIDADGQEVGIDENFIVDGEELEYPGDPSGSAENKINCQCFMHFNIEE